MKNSRDYSFLNKYPKVLTIASFIGLVASFWQAAERVHMLKYPTVALNCNLSPVVDCSGVLGNKWAALFGFPNAFLGIVMFTILFTAGLLLWSGGEFTRKFHRLIMAVSTILILFSVWFFGMSLYVIGKVCIFCIFIWAASVPIYWYGLLYYLSLHAKQHGWKKQLLRFGSKNHLFVVYAVYTTMIVLFLFRFSDYYFR
jgi:uncharacterized membrane protein